MRILADVDTGIDDALALAYLATFSDAELLGAIGTYGNVATDTAVRNTAYVLELLELPQPASMDTASKAAA